MFVYFRLSISVLQYEGVTSRDALIAFFLSSVWLLQNVLIQQLRMIVRIYTHSQAFHVFQALTLQVVK